MNILAISWARFSKLVNGLVMLANFKYFRKLVLISLLFSFEAMAHSGGTDKSGCHAMDRMTWDVVEQVEFWDMRVHCHEILSDEELAHIESDEYQRDQLIRLIQSMLDGHYENEIAVDGIIGKTTLLAMNHFVWDNGYKFSYLDETSPFTLVKKDNIEKLDLEHFKTLLAVNWQCGKGMDKADWCAKYYRTEADRVGWKKHKAELAKNSN